LNPFAKTQKFPIFEYMEPREPIHYYTAAEYLALEETAEYRSEYFGGEIFAMAGSTPNHDRICGECGRLIGNALLDSKCEVFTSNMKVKIEHSNAYYYPDLSAACGKSKFDQDGILTNPTLIIEVLSDSTVDFDWGKKFMRYRQISSLKEYVLISQKEPCIDVFYKTEEGDWNFLSYEGMDAVVELRSLGIQLKLSDIYRRVEFPAEP
jgi:Uma2 family endonuclease